LFDLLNIKASDKIRAIEVLAKMHGWNASEKANLSGESKIERIEWVVVEPKNQDGGGVTPLLAKGRYKGAFGGRGSWQEPFLRSLGMGRVGRTSTEHGSRMI
jgi:hypothetical protein